MWVGVWLLIAAATALAITFDMQALEMRRIGLSRAGWIIACIGVGPLAGAAYLVQRRIARRTMMLAVWQAVGDSKEPLAVRRQRLMALRSSALISMEIYLTCMEKLDAETHGEH